MSVSNEKYVMQHTRPHTCIFSSFIAHPEPLKIKLMSASRLEEAYLRFVGAQMGTEYRKFGMSNLTSATAANAHTQPHVHTPPHVITAPRTRTRTRTRTYMYKTISHTINIATMISTRTGESRGRGFFVNLTTPAFVTCRGTLKLA